MTVISLSSVPILFAVAIAAVPASAKTVDILQQSPNIYAPFGGSPERLKAKGNYPKLPGGADQQVRNQSFGQYQLKQRDTGSGDPFVDFVAFCIDIATPMRTSASSVVEYETPGEPFDYGQGLTRRQLIGTLFVNEWDPDAGVVHQAAMQMTLWKLAHGDLSGPASDGFDLFAPSYEGLDGAYFDYDTDPFGFPIPDDMASKFPAVTALAASWLEALDGDGFGDWDVGNPLNQIGVEYYVAGNSQSIVTYVPPGPGPGPDVPLPAGVWLLGSALGLGGALRWWRKA